MYNRAFTATVRFRPPLFPHTRMNILGVALHKPDMNRLTLITAITVAFWGAVVTLFQLPAASAATLLAAWFVTCVMACSGVNIVTGGWRHVVLWVSVMAVINAAGRTFLM